MGFMDAVKKCLSLYVTFSGRARRSEYWWFVLFTFLVQIVASFIDSALFGADTQILGALAGLALILPSLAVGARRLHDIDRTAWWLLIGLVPLIGAIVLIIFFIQRGTEGPNRFGPDPKAGDSAASASAS